MIPFGNLGDAFRGAGKFREMMEKANEALGGLQAEATVGGGAVTARANGRFEVLSIKVDPKLLADGDAELLEDLVVAAVNEALAKARASAADSIRSMAGGLPLGGLFGGPDLPE